MRTLQACPIFLRGQWRSSLQWILRRRAECAQSGDQLGELRSWKLFLLLPLMLLRRTENRGNAGRRELEERFLQFQRGSWQELLSPIEKVSKVPRASPPEHDSVSARANAAQTAVSLGEVSRARQRLVGASLAPCDENTREKLQERRAVDVQSPLSPEVLNFQPSERLSLDRKTFFSCLKSAPRGSAAGPGGMTYEQLRVLLDDPAGAKDLASAADMFTRGHLPEEIWIALMRAQMIALCKPEGGVRGNSCRTQLPATGREITRPAVRPRDGGSVQPIPVRFIHESRNRLHWTRHSIHDGARPATDCHGHRRSDCV